MLYDNGRGHFNYLTSWFWAALMTVLPNGKVLSVNMGDGLGAQFHDDDKSYEDFLTYDGKIYMLDQTEMNYN
jgi:hypothetical protein